MMKANNYTEETSCSNLNDDDAKVDLKGKEEEEAKAPQKVIYECNLCKNHLNSLSKLEEHIDGDKCKVLKKVNAHCMKKYKTKDPSSVMKKLDAEDQEKKNKDRLINNNVGKYDCKLCHYGPINSPNELKLHLETVCMAIKKRELQKLAIADGDLSSQVNEEKVNEIKRAPST